MPSLGWLDRYTMPFETWLQLSPFGQHISRAVVAGPGEEIPGLGVYSPAAILDIMPFLRWCNLQNLQPLNRHRYHLRSGWIQSWKEWATMMLKWSSRECSWHCWHGGTWALHSLKWSWAANQVGQHASSRKAQGSGESGEGLQFHNDKSMTPGGEISKRHARAAVEKEQWHCFSTLWRHACSITLWELLLLVPMNQNVRNLLDSRWFFINSWIRLIKMKSTGATFWELNGSKSNENQEMADWAAS